MGTAATAATAPPASAGPPQWTIQGTTNPAGANANNVRGGLHRRRIVERRDLLWPAPGRHARRALLLTIRRIVQTGMRSSAGPLPRTVTRELISALTAMTLAQA